ncbi:hypothetical protein [Sphingobacterium sp. DR205]|uniref:hypothetical protein n=1 Tax=Sphingobacterium sp. DR205 TaxID=2713573 RepID=UPI0013E43E22|nr:hypothetical protein [Sphingobacterium sp. DR205]QIH32982.1 hypothetical protein G6053_08810 [Sphingobacterium sp. DR205]
MKYFFVLLLGLFLLSSCDKEEVDHDSMEIDGSTFAKKNQFISRSVGFSVNQLYVDQTVDKNFYLGTVWGLKDTMPTVGLTPLRSHYKPFKITLVPTTPVIPSVKIAPTFESIRSYARKNKSSEPAMSGFSVTDFFDYESIRYHLNNSPDVDSVLKLVEHHDSTTIKRAYSCLMRSENISFSLMAQLNEFSSAFRSKDVVQLMQDGFNPYYMNVVNYGTHVIMMGESDFPRIDFKNALDKLLSGQPLTEKEETILNASDLLIYLRGGKKESFIKRANGLEGIVKLVKEFNKEFEKQSNSFDFPISYSLRSLDDFSLLKFWYSYDFLVREEKSN